MKESRGWKDVADSIHIQQKIREDRRRVMERLALGILLLLGLLVLLYNYA